MQATTTMQQLSKIAREDSAVEARELVNIARISTSILFLADGMAFGTWAALIPSFQQKFQLSPGQLSVVLLGLVTGAMVSMPLTGKLIGRWGSHRVASPACVGFVTTLLLLAFASNYFTLILAALFFGLWKGALDVSINSQAITVEKTIRRPVNGSFQGWWSVGGLSAASLLSVLMHQGYAPRGLMVGMAMLLLPPSIWAFGRLLPDSAPSKTGKSLGSSKKPHLLWLLGGVAFLALFSEGVMFDWAAVYIHASGGLSVAQAPMGFAACTLCMAAARFFGDRLTLKAGAVNTLRISGLIMAGGIAVAVATNYWLAILVGFALVGFGTANMVPVIYSATGKLQGHGTGASLATVATLGYLGFLSGPPLIGFVADAGGLAVALSLVIVTGTTIATVGAVIVRRALTTSQARTAGPNKERHSRLCSLRVFKA